MAPGTRRPVNTTSSVSAHEETIPPPERRDALQKAMLGWVATNGRSFPWRKPAATPYQVLVAELLLKRTTASAAARLFPQFLYKYPAHAHLVTSSEEELARDLVPVGLHVQRAKAVVRLAQYLDKHESGMVPTTLERLKRVPGLGDYSARAILSFGHGTPVAVVDANVARILQRLFQEVMPRRPSQGLLQSVADSILPKSDHQMFNFGLLDIGALVCRYVDPKCAACPLIGLCDYASGAGKAQEHAKPLTSRLRQVRMGKGVSLVKLARDARVTKLTIINIEAGRTRPRTDTVRKLAGALGVPPEEVAPGTVHTPNR